MLPRLFQNILKEYCIVYGKNYKNRRTLRWLISEWSIFSYVVDRLGMLNSKIDDHAYQYNMPIKLPTHLSQLHPWQHSGLSINTHEIIHHGSHDHHSNNIINLPNINRTNSLPLGHHSHFSNSFHMNCLNKNNSDIIQLNKSKKKYNKKQIINISKNITINNNNNLSNINNIECIAHETPKLCRCKHCGAIQNISEEKQLKQLKKQFNIVKSKGYTHTKKTIITKKSFKNKKTRIIIQNSQKIDADASHDNIPKIIRDAFANSDSMDDIGMLL